MGRERAMHGNMHVILTKLQVSMQNVRRKNYYLFQQPLQQTNAMRGGQDSKKGRSMRRYVIYIGPQTAWFVQARQYHDTNTLTRKSHLCLLGHLSHILLLLPSLFAG